MEKIWEIKEKSRNSSQTRETIVYNFNLAFEKNSIVYGLKHFLTRTRIWKQGQEIFHPERRNKVVLGMEQKWSFEEPEFEN